MSALAFSLLLTASPQTRWLPLDINVSRMYPGNRHYYQFASDRPPFSVKQPSTVLIAIPSSR